MKTLIPYGWKDYELIDVGDGEKLERWGKYVLRRPEPQAVWPRELPSNTWNKIDAWYHRSNSGGGSWEFRTNTPEQWQISYQNLSFYIEPSGFKHTGLFPEQAVNWEWMINKCNNANRPISALNLFAYTGGATLALAHAGAKVCHVDSSKGMVQRAKDNAHLSHLAEKNIRFIVDDVLKFVKREQRRGNKYDAIIMDPPSFGRGPKGEVWKLEESLFELVRECLMIMSENPVFFIINAYTTGLSPITVKNILNKTINIKYKGKVECGDLALKASSSELLLPCGLFSRWEIE